MAATFDGEWAREIGKAVARGWRAATLGTDPEDIEPLVLGLVPEDGVVGSAFPPCPPDSSMSPVLPEFGSADLPSSTTTSGGQGSSPPPLYITSKLEEKGPQTIVLHAGGT